MPQKTKKKLLERSMALFAEKGFAEASVRDIAAAANVNISAIKYYFGNKRGLYDSILKLFVRFVRTDIAGLYRTATVVLELTPSNPKKAEKCVCDLFSELARLLCSQRISNDAIRIFLREYADTSASFKIVDEGLLRPIHHLVARLIVVVSRNTLSLQDAYLHVFPLLAQLFVFKSHQTAIADCCGWAGYGQTEISRITALCLQQTEAILNSLKPKKV